MKCIKCGVSMEETPLHRTAPLEASNADWMCQPCIAIDRPELTSHRLIRKHFTAQFYDVGNCFYVDPEIGR